MHGQERFTRFFTYLNMFAFSMLVLVLAGNYLLLFLGWEGVGLCSYLLISFWFEKPSAARAGKKAFVTNRVGDFGFMLAMFLIFSHLGTLELPAALSERLAPVGRPRPPPSPCSSTSPPPARAPRARCSSGSPTPWRAPPRCRPSSTPPPWSPPACTCWSARTRSWSSARPPATSSPGSAPSPPWWPPPSPSSTSTSSGCWPTRRSASSATCSWPSGSAPTRPPSSTWSPTPSSRRSCSSAPAR